MDSPVFDDSPMPDPPVEFVNTHSPVRRSRGWTWLAWVAIILTVVLMALPLQLSDDPTATDSSIAIQTIQARYLVGAASIFPENRELLLQQLDEMFGHGPVTHQLIGAVLVGELIGPEEAIEVIDDIDSQIEVGSLKASAEDTEAVHFLTKLQTSRIGKQNGEEPISPEQLQSGRTLLQERLGWVGRLAMTPPDSDDHTERKNLKEQARRSLFTIMGAFGLALVAFLVGTLIQLTFWGLAIGGWLKSGIRPLAGDSGIYAETFALWMVVFVTLNVVVLFLPLPSRSMVWLFIPQVGSLGVLAWPVLRGLRWSDVRRDVGLTFQPQAWSAPFVGIGAYLAAAPVVAAAMVVTFLLIFLISLTSGAEEAVAEPGHPIVDHILRGSWTTKIQLMCVAIFAAVPEEIMFRGFLYRHLRAASENWGYVPSVAFATLFNSFLFAIIHPQGLLGLPILMGLATVFSLVREWRGSLVPCMITHALVNAGTTTLLLLVTE
ncbi:lysostaphin resistance A-like protein [Schlesneria sp.]|uniref:CPBP family intramembrane glutamic endopeptidase n=1 Tax=Schlesneria sp. TaxID=2762018 RepID=UPI002EE67E65